MVFLRQAAEVLLRHPAYLFSRFSPLYSKYERARMMALRKSALSPVFCVGMFHILPDSGDTNQGVTSSILLRGGIYEPEATSVFVQLLLPGDTVIDVGANIGWYTLAAAKTVGPQGLVIAFEPEPHNFQLLTESIALNNLGNVAAIERCVSDRNGEATLILSGSNAGGHSIVCPSDRSSRLRVVTTTLDQVVTDLGLDRVDVIKIDAESAEPLIVRGAKGIISRSCVRAIFMEFSPLAWEGHAETLSRFFVEFDVFEIRRFSLGMITPSTLPKNRQAMLLFKRKKATAIQGASNDCRANSHHPRLL